MFWLPGFNLDRKSYWLPLSRGTADFLMRWLVAAVDVGSLAFVPILRLDPAFCLWLACRYPGATGAESFAELSLLLCPQTLLALLVGDVVDEPTLESRSDCLRQWSQITRQLQSSVHHDFPDGDDREVAAVHARYLRVALRLGITAELSRTLPTVQHPVCLAVSNKWCDDDGVNCEYPELDHINLKAITWHWREAEDDEQVRETLPLLVRNLLRLALLEKDFDKQLETAKLAAIKEFAYGAGHEINNPLANISTRAQTLLQDETDPERRRRLATINTQAFRAHEMIADMMLFANPPNLNQQTVDIRDVVQQAVDELRNHEMAESVTIFTEFVGDLSGMELDATQLTVALKAIGRNSLEAIDGTGILKFHTRRDCDGQEPFPLKIAITDTAAGIPHELIEHLFEPYFSGREAGRGLGMGLSKAWRIVTDHGGQIDVNSGANGSTFTIRLPARQPVDR